MFPSASLSVSLSVLQFARKSASPAGRSLVLETLEQKCRELYTQTLEQKCRELYTQTLEQKCREL